MPPMASFRAFAAVAASHPCELCSAGFAVGRQCPTVGCLLVDGRRHTKLSVSAKTRGETGQKIRPRGSRDGGDLSHELGKGMIPGLQQVMSATRGATDAFSGVTRHVNSALRKAGLNNIEAGIGCGVGIGHGFGIGIALKPRVLHEIQSSVGEIMSKFTSRLKDAPGEISVSNPMTGSLSSNQQTHNRKSMDLDANTAERNFNHTTSNEMSRIQPTHVSHGQHVVPPEELTGSRTEKVISNFLQSPLFQSDSKIELRDSSEKSHGMDNVLQLVIKHQRVIEELQEENENLRQVLIEELKVSPTKLQIDRKHGVSAYYPCSDCFECRRRSRKKTR